MLFDQLTAAFPNFHCPRTMTGQKPSKLSRINCFMRKKTAPATQKSTSRPNTRIDLERMRAARKKISGVFLDTPQFECPALGELLGCEFVVKLETANPIGCFKGRGTEVVTSRIAAGPGPRAAVAGGRPVQLTSRTWPRTRGTSRCARRALPAWAAP